MYLYRHYSADDVLLYVGISNRPLTRLDQHRRGAAWFDQIQRVEIQQCRDRAHAERAEAWAIWTERPRFNIQNAIALMSNAEAGAAVRYTLAEAYKLAAEGERLATIDPIEFKTMGRAERREHRRHLKRLARSAHRNATLP